MGCRTKIFFLSFLAINLLFLSTLTHAYTNITAIFAFGDSILDPGNNNRRATLTRSDHPPYGRDFPGHVATGRFSNGKLATDILISQLGIKELLPAYLDPKITDHDLVTGVSFASAGTGLDDLTAKQSNVYTFSSQLKFFAECLQRIQRTVGAQEAGHIVQNAVVVIAAGTNDVVDNFYVLPTRRTFSLSGYHDFLLRNLEGYLRRMYSMGARRFAVTGLPPVGCLPVQVTIGSITPSLHMLQRVCVNQQNVDSKKYNIKLQALISRLQTTLSGSKFAYVDAYNSLIDMITNPAKYGFQHTLEGCCGTGSVEFGLSCNQINPTCRNSSKYVFWDAVHPTEAAYRNLARNTLQTVLPQLVD